MQDQRFTHAALATFDDLEHELCTFMEAVTGWFRTHPKLSKLHPPVIHSLKSRIKDREHLKEKISRKSTPQDTIDDTNLPQKITDLTGVRVLHLHQDQLKEIHSEILHKVNHKKDWHLHERPRAYTWDPEAKKFFETLGLDVHVRETFYTSVHYVIRPRDNSPLCCEIQVRTLFEEIWGEVDHALNYPEKSDNIALREQLLVLAKVVGAGSRLVDSIYRTRAAELPPSTQSQVHSPEQQSTGATPETPPVEPVSVNPSSPNVDAMIEGSEDAQNGDAASPITSSASSTTSGLPDLP